MSVGEGLAGSCIPSWLYLYISLTLLTTDLFLTKLHAIVIADET